MKLFIQYDDQNILINDVAYFNKQKKNYTPICSYLFFLTTLQVHTDRIIF